MMTKMSRRAFARLAATAAVAGVAPATPPARAAEVGGATQNPEVEARIQWILTKYGSHLNDGQRADIRRIVSGGQSGVDDMRKYALDNADEPAEPFRPYRKAAKK